MGFWGSEATLTLAGVTPVMSYNQSHEKPKNFEKYKLEIEKTKAYIKAKREAFYKNNNLKDR